MTSDDLTDDTQSDPGRLRSMYEEASAKAAAAEARATELERREAFRDAGLDPSNRLHQTVMKAYDGPFEPDAVKTYVSELGITQPTPVVEQDTTDQDALIRIAQAAMGDGQPGPTPDRRAQLQAEMEAAYRRKAPKQELQRIAEEFTRAGGFRALADIPGSKDN